MEESIAKNKYRRVAALLVSWLVGLYGVYIVLVTLLSQFNARHVFKYVNSWQIDIHLLLGLGLVYLSVLLSRGKRNAWIVACGIYAFMLGEGTDMLFSQHSLTKSGLAVLIRSVVLPVIIFLILILARDDFKVRSDMAAFRGSLKIAVLVLAITLAYGVSGFLLMDNTDFHHEISFTSAVHHTIDQFDLTTNTPLHPYTKRAKLFMDSLSFVSLLAVAYAALSLFQPVRLRFGDQTASRGRLLDLMRRYGAPSEDFFKLWPQDKHYFFSQSGGSGLAYRVQRGTALVLADPVGDPNDFAALLAQFADYCYGNGWSPSLIHVAPDWIDLYKQLGYDLQLIGQEAVVSLSHFQAETVKNKYFRNIANRFKKDNYRVEFLNPPHHQAVVDRLRQISQDWLAHPGRSERGFVMGYFNLEYLDRCRLLIARDAAQTIQGFINLVPADFDRHEATFDMMRHADNAPSNINDFMLMEMIVKLQAEGYERLNLGLSPLVGLDEPSEENSLIGRVLRFAYANGDRFYSFSGLYRFKAKYEPHWSDRYIVYRGGVRGFSRTLNSLLKAMRYLRKP